MTGSWVLLAIFLIASIPVIAVFVWFRLAKYQLSLERFLFALLAGAAAFFPALLLQAFFTFSSFPEGRLALFLQVFVRVAFTEELSRLLLLMIFFWLTSRYNTDEEGGSAFDAVKSATAIGLVAGLGFAILESSRFAASDMNTGILLLRAFTAAPLHAACGSRIGAAAVMIRTNPVQAFMRILTATAIHGIYNFMVAMPGLPSIAALLIAFSALFTAVLTIHSAHNSGNENQIN